MKFRIGSVSTNQAAYQNKDVENDTRRRRSDKYERRKKKKKKIK